MLTRHNPVWEYILILVMEHASISLSEDMMLRSSFHYITNDKLQCEQKVDRYYDLNISRKKMEPEEALTEAYRFVEAQNHCDKVLPSPLYEIDGYQYYTCACNFQHPDFNFLITLFGEYNKYGTLPFPGALADQPAYIMEVFQILKSLKLEKDAEDAAKQEKQNRRR